MYLDRLGIMYYYVLLLGPSFHHVYCFFFALFHFAFSPPLALARRGGANQKPKSPQEANQRSEKPTHKDRISSPLPAPPVSVAPNCASRDLLFSVAGLGKRLKQYSHHPCMKLWIVDNTPCLHWTFTPLLGTAMFSGPNVFLECRLWISAAAQI
jgi:hypothetical protein